MAYTEIINEVQEQIEELQSSIASHQETITSSTNAITRLEAQVVGLQQLKANAESLNSQDKVSIDLNVNVTTDANSEASVIRHSSPTSVNQ